MAGKRELVTYVFADDAWHKPGDDVPDSVTNPKAWGGDPKDEVKPEPDQGEPRKFPGGDPADSWKVDELKAYAESKQTDLGEAKTKAEILAILGKA